MKLDRLIGILSILLQRQRVTAPELAQLFEVSRRTISRDVDTLCQAGLPIVTLPGAAGGISLMENYKLDRTLLTSTEMQDILAGLRGLDSVQGTHCCRQLMEKLLPGSSDLLVGDQSVLIDLSAWDQGSLAPKIQCIRQAIAQSQELRFYYYGPRGESLRQIQPYYLIFRWSSWYVWGWCTQRKDFRLFKLTRMDQVEQTSISFEKHPAALPDLSNQRIFPGGIQVRALFSADCKWRLIEEFGPHCFQIQPDGQLLFSAEYTNKENLLTWLLTFHDQAELLEPVELREELQELLTHVLKRYQ